MASLSVYDPLVKELSAELPVRAGIPRIASESTPLSNDILDAPPGYYRSVLDLDQGSYDLAIVASFYLAYAMPSGFAQRNLLYLQLLASELTSAEHYTTRDGLRSYLCAQTFYGEGELDYEGERFHLAPGDVFLLDCMRPHAYRAVSPQGWGYRIIHFAGMSLPGLYAPLLEEGRFVFHLDEGHSLFRFTKELYRVHQQGHPSRELEEHRLLTSIVSELLALLPRFDAAPREGRMAEVTRYLDDHCTEDFSLDDLARLFHTSKYHLCRQFKEATGTTVFSYVTERRMDLATFLLTSGGSNIEEVARACGYANVSSFFYAFRKHAGMAPTTYRKHYGR